VGNYLKSYVSTTYRIKFYYNVRLNLVEESARLFSVDNRALARDEKTTSRIQFQIFEKGRIGADPINDLEQLNSYLKKNYPGIPFLPERLGGLVGFRSFSGTDPTGPGEASALGQYYLFTPKKDLLR